VTVNLRSPGETAYYVDSLHGNDRRKGTSPDLAWKTLERLNRMVFAPGDRILFRAGSRFVGEQFHPQGSGTEQEPIEVNVYEDGPAPLIEAQGRFHEAILLRNQECWEIAGLAVTNTGRTREKSRFGVHVVAWDFGTMHHIVLRNLEVQDVNGSLMKEDRGEGHGIFWESGGETLKSRFDVLIIEKCHLLRTDRNGISGYSEFSHRDNWFPSLHVIIRYNLLEDIGGDGIKLWGCDGAVVEYNHLYKGSQRCPDYAAGIWPWSCDHTLIQHNEVSGMKGTHDGQAFDSDGNCTDTIFQYNYSHNNDGGFMLICDDGAWGAPQSAGNHVTIVRYNISQNDGARTFHLAGPVHDVKIYNNDFYIGEDLDLPLFLFNNDHGWPDGLYVANNIFYVTGKATVMRSGTERNADGSYKSAEGPGMALNLTLEDNVYFGGIERPTTDVHAIASNPMLINPGSGSSGMDTLDGYKLKESSPCLDAGVSIKENGGQDFWGDKVAVDLNPDIGAQEAKKEVTQSGGSAQEQ
jgi:Right handed beta helix region